MIGTSRFYKRQGCPRWMARFPPAGSWLVAEPRWEGAKSKWRSPLAALASEIFAARPPPFPTAPPAMLPLFLRSILHP